MVSGKPGGGRHRGRFDSLHSGIDSQGANTVAICSKALVTVERERVFSYFVLDVRRACPRLTSQSSASMCPTYVTVQVIRSPKGLSRARLQEHSYPVDLRRDGEG